MPGPSVLLDGFQTVYQRGDPPPDRGFAFLGVLLTEAGNSIRKCALSLRSDFTNTGARGWYVVDGRRSEA
jgi:hypothetical protein